MELNEENKNNPGSLVFMLTAAYRNTKSLGWNEQDLHWATTAGEINRFCRRIVKTDPRWKYVGMAIFNVWKSYYTILSIYATRSILKSFRIKSEERVLSERLAEFNRQAAIWEGIRDGK